MNCDAFPPIAGNLSRQLVDRIEPRPISASSKLEHLEIKEDELVLRGRRRGSFPCCGGSL